MTTYVALLRSVNVGGHNKLPMAELRAALGDAGYDDVRTYIQSGNAVFSTDAATSAADIEAVIAQRFGRQVSTILRTAGELRRVVDDNPFTEVDTTKLHVGFMAAAPDPRLVSAIDTERFAPERCAIRGAEQYFYLPAGMARTRLPDHIHRTLQARATIRNWATVGALVALTA